MASYSIIETISLRAFAGWLSTRMAKYPSPSASANWCLTNLSMDKPSSLVTGNEAITSCAGISLGYDLRLFLPLNISAFEVKDNKLKDWCKSWMGSDYSPPLEPARTGSGRDTSPVFTSGPHLQRQYW